MKNYLDSQCPNIYLRTFRLHFSSTEDESFYLTPLGCLREIRLVLIFSFPINWSLPRSRKYKFEMCVSRTRGSTVQTCRRELPEMAVDKSENFQLEWKGISSSSKKTLWCQPGGKPHLRDWKNTKRNRRCGFFPSEILVKIFLKAYNLEQIYNIYINECIYFKLSTGSVS